MVESEDDKVVDKLPWNDSEEILGIDGMIVGSGWLCKVLLGKNKSNFIKIINSIFIQL